MKEPASDFEDRSYPIQEDMAFQRRVWRFERIGWYVLVLIVLLTLGGLFSKGPLSSRSVSSADGRLQVTYELFHRGGATSPMVVQVQGGPRQVVEVEIDGELLQGFSIDTLQPTPVRSSTAGQGVRLWLQADEQGRSVLYLSLRSDGLGLYKSHIGTPGVEPVQLSQFIYP